MDKSRLWLPIILMIFATAGTAYQKTTFYPFYPYRPSPYEPSFRQASLLRLTSSNPLPNKAKTTVQPTKTTSAIDCNYHFPTFTPIDSDLLKKWAENAVIQSFSFDHHALDMQLKALKGCYTESGWKGFNDALQKSGNIETIKSQNLISNSTINGAIQILSSTANQWKLSIPLEVNYLNDKEKLQQTLLINLTIGRKDSSNLGIIQMIAVTPNLTTPSTSTKQFNSPNTAPATKPKT